MNPTWPICEHCKERYDFRRISIDESMITPMVTFAFIHRCDLDESGLLIGTSISLQVGAVARKVLGS